MKNEIAILLPYKEQYTKDDAGAASIWVKDYINKSKFKDRTIVYGNLNKKFKPFTNNFKSINFDGYNLKKISLIQKNFIKNIKNINLRLLKFIIDLNH